MRPGGVVSLWLHWLTAGCITALFGWSLYILANLDSWILYEDSWELIALLAMQLLLALAIGVVAASLGLVCSLPVLLWLNRRGKSEDAGQLADFTAATACGSLLLQAAVQWLNAVGLWSPPRALKYWIWAIFFVAFATSLLSARARREILPRLSTVFDNRLSRRVLIGAAVGAAVVAAPALVRFPRRTPRLHGRQGPNVLLITFDALSCEDMSAYGYHLPTTPFIGAFAQTGSLFENYFSSATFTTPSIASMLTGRYPSSTHVYHLGGHLRGDDRSKTLPREMRRAGYVTAASVGNPWAYPNRLGIAADFDHLPLPPLLNYRVPNELLRVPSSNLFYMQESAEYFAASKIRFLVDASFRSESSFPPVTSFRQAEDLLRRIEAPYFLWVHVFAPHAPYLPSAPFAQRFTGPVDEAKLAAALERLNYLPQGRYKPGLQPTLDTVRLRYGEWIAEADAAFGDFMTRAEQSGRLNDTFVIVSADHGESFQGGVYGHKSSRQTRPMIHVPLIIRSPGQSQGKRLAAVADHTALAPTILDLVGLERPDWMEGTSLRPAIERDDEGGITGLAFTEHLERNSIFKPLRNGTLGVTDGRYRYLHDIATSRGVLTALGDAHIAEPDPSSFNSAVAQAFRRELSGRFPQAFGTT